jgi:CubicO group peptidase (beta-lactamase class C family)
MSIAKLLLLISLSFISCKTSQSIARAKDERFTKELTTLKDFFHIPGLSVLVKQGDSLVYEKYLGLAKTDPNTGMDSNTTVPLASLTKIFSSILMLQLAEEKALDLNDPVRMYVNDPDIWDSIKIKHVLSHTSQGALGEHFYYSSRYSWLTRVIEKASGKSFKELINEKIIRPLRMDNTYLLEDSLQLKTEKRKLAGPYVYQGVTKKGFIDYGYSSAAGIVSTVRDLAKLSDALDKNLLISNESKEMMFKPSEKDLPYGYGIFRQNLSGHKLLWGYGQYDCYSSLFLKVPDSRLTFIITANNNLASDPPRLIYGNVAYSLFAVSFLKHFVLDLASAPLFENENSLSSLGTRINTSNSEFYLKKLLAQALSESFMGVYHAENAARSRSILRTVFRQYPDYATYGDLPLLHNLTNLRYWAKKDSTGIIGEFDTQIEAIGNNLLQKDSNNPYANSTWVLIIMQKATS